MKKKISKILHFVHISGIYMFGMFVMSKLEWPDFVYPLWTLIYAIGYIAYDLDHGDWPGNKEERKSNKGDV